MPSDDREHFGQKIAEAAFHELHRKGWRCRLLGHSWEPQIIDFNPPPRQGLVKCRRCGAMQLRGAWRPEDWLTEDELPYWPPPPLGMNTFHSDGRHEMPDRIVHPDNRVEWK